MTPIPFHPDELKDGVCHPPISPEDNLRLLLRGEKPLWMADHNCVRFFNPRIVPDNVARGIVLDADCPGFAEAAEFAGGKDMFGVEWVYVPVANGSMVVPGSPKVKDLSHWEDYITFPDLDSYDWAGCAEHNRAYLEQGGMISCWVTNGLFERLISFVDMENALVAMIDEDEQEHVHRLFDRLCDFYADLFAHYKKYFNNEMFFFHDDWGSQNAPFFSPDTVEEMLVPYLKRIIQSAHDLGCWVEFHSCGKNEMLVPCMIEAGADLWDGQTLNDFERLYSLYGDQIHFQPYAPVLTADASEAEIREAARRYVDTYPSGTCVSTTRNRMPPQIAQIFDRCVYEFSRIAYCGRGE